MYPNSTEQDPSYLLEKMIQLREDVYREGTETFQRWESRIKRTSFLNSAQNLALLFIIKEKRYSGYSRRVNTLGAFFFRKIGITNP